jgi:NADH-quinone oxidoreductase subunit J
MDYVIVIFFIASFLALLSSVLVFFLKDMLYAVLALTMLFIFNSLLFLVLQQPLLAVIQIFIMVGGVSTFLFVGVASAELMQFRFTKLAGLLLLWVVVFAAIAYPMYSKGVRISSTSINTFGTQEIAASLGQYYALYYVMMLLLFTVSIGAIVALKRMGDGR